MKIVGITACPTGIAHTYMTRKKLIKAAEHCGHSCKIETQGSIGIENELTAQEIEEADIVILAVDVKVLGEGRFKEKPLVRVGTEAVMKNPVEFIKKIEAALNKSKNK